MTAATFHAHALIAAATLLAGAADALIRYAVMSIPSTGDDMTPNLTPAEHLELQHLADTTTPTEGWSYRTNARVLSSLHAAGYVVFRDERDHAGNWYRRYRITADGLAAHRALRGA